MFPLRTAETVVLFFVSQSGLQVLAVADSAAPEWEIGLDALRLQRPNDGCRAIAAIGNRFTDRDLVAIADTLQLVEVRLVVGAALRLSPPCPE